MDKYRPTVYSKDDIQAEYDLSSRSDREFEMVKWGSHEKMCNRFRLVMEVIDFNSVDKWLDVGSGTGAFQSLVMERFQQLEAVGIDLSLRLIQYSNAREDLIGSSVTFVHSDFLKFDQSDFDFISCVGVLQKTNIKPQDFFNKSWRMLNSGGRLFVDTKNISWGKFDESFRLEASHQWFDPDQLIDCAVTAGYENVKVEGFLPGENRVVEKENSHTIFLCADKA